MRFKEYETGDGLVCYILIKHYFENKKVMFKMHYPNVVEPHYYIPETTFHKPDEVIDHILKNLVTNGLKIEVIPMDNSVKYNY